MMRILLLLFPFLLLSCGNSIDEELLARRMEDNNKVLEKQINLLQKDLVLTLAEEENSQVQQLFEASGIWLEQAEIELEGCHSAAECTEILNEVASRFNDSMRKHSTLFVDWKPEQISSEERRLFSAWKQNNFLLLSLVITEQCVLLHEAKSHDASRSLRPVIYTSQYNQVLKGRNAIFEVAFKSKKPQLVDLKIDKALLNGKKISLKQIDVDRYTQRFILLSLEKGDYVITGRLIMVNDLGEKETFPFEESFRVE